MKSKFLKFSTKSFAYLGIDHNIKILVTGASGRLGLALTKELYKKYGMSNIISSDIEDKSTNCDNSRILEGKFIKLDVTDKKYFGEIVKAFKINKIIHLADIPSQDCEKDVVLSTKVNIEGVHNVLELAKDNKLQVFIPSSLEVYNGNKINSEEAFLDPHNLYGIHKLYMENLGKYYFEKFGVDFRCLRCPIILSKDDLNGSFPYDLIDSAIRQESYKIWMDINLKFPFVHFSDFTRGLFQFLDSHNSLLRRRVYNLGGMSFTAAAYLKEVKKVIKYSSSHEIDIARMAYLKLFPEEVNDRNARVDWGWHPQIITTKKLVEHILTNMN